MDAKEVLLLVSLIGSFILIVLAVNMVQALYAADKIKKSESNWLYYLAIFFPIVGFLVVYNINKRLNKNSV